MTEPEAPERGESRKKAVIAAAQRLLAEATSLEVRQVHEITLREVDAYAEDNVPVVTFIPIGGVIGIAVHRQDELIKDSDIVFVWAGAFANMLPALGFTAAGPAVAIISPADARGSKPDVRS